MLLTAAGVVTVPAVAGEVAIKVTIPQIEQTGPRAPARPYIAVWVRKDDNSFASDLAVWYQIEARQRRARPEGANGAPPTGGAPGEAPQAGAGAPPREGGPPRGEGGEQRQRRPENPKTPGGARWLNEVREWWADSGNQLQFPVDGLTSASRAAGTHELTFSDQDPKLAKLAPGKYKLMVEASREHGGEETVSVPFTWPIKAAHTAKASGKTELGAIELALKP
ncbi:MAG: DUF2271 domain-containing protein [Steroidobacteraceae bacterium]